jgi:hypothetical protein
MKTLARNGVVYLSLFLLGIAGAGAPVNGPTSAWTQSLHLTSGEPVDVAPWGEQASWEGDGDIGLWWEDPRDIRSVVVSFTERPPDPVAVRLQWWRSRWPESRVPRDRPVGAGESGWLHLGDLYQGEWRDADAELNVTGNTWRFTFRPVNAKEFPKLKEFAADYRTTMKLRLVGEGLAGKVAKIAAFTDSVWREGLVEVEWGGKSEREVWDGRFEVFNGYVDRVEPLDLAGKVVVNAAGQWKSIVNGKPAGVRAHVWFAASPNANTFDGTVVTVRALEHSFSFDPAEVAAGKQVFAPQLGVLVKRAGTPGDYREAAARWQQVRGRGEKPIYDRTFSEPEQSLARAMAEQPPHGQFYIPLGTEGGRQRFGVEPDGSVFCVNDRIDRPAGKDTPRRTWGGQRLRYKFSLPLEKPARRWLEDECLPIIHTEWERAGIRYAQSAFVTRLGGGGLGFPDMAADDTTVLMLKIAGHNLTNEYRPATVTLSLQADDHPLELILRNDGLCYARLASGDVLRCQVDVSSSAFTAHTNRQIQFSGNLPPGSEGHMIVKIPFITLDQPGELEQLRALDWDEEFKRVKKFWTSRADASARIITPVPEINHFYRAHVSHLLINCGREVGSDRLMARVGSFAYGVYGNESCMMITDMDRRGLHREAERCLETFLRYQGTVALPGDYASQTGVFNGANGWESGGYNQHHGWIMWAMAEHYWYTGDKAWLERNAGSLVRACRWIINERARTRDFDGLRRIERGLLPPGSLEDIGDWRCWMSNNGFSWWGLNAVAKALADIGHPESKLLQEEADAYRRAIITAFREAMVRSPLVSLRDGSWIPQIPSEVHRRGRTFGWITVTLEGPIYLVRTGLLAPDDPLALNIMQDYEDNLYLSERYGYSWQKHGQWWFSRGGISMQPNLLCSPHPYLLRDEVKHYLRAYFNAFASCYYPDTQLMCEHPLPDLGDWRGDHYKASDESNSTYWLRMMFIEDERNENLYLGLALPRAWLADGQRPSIERAATHFGPMSLQYESRAASGSIAAQFDPPTRRVPERTYLRFRHPDVKPIRRVEINGRAWDKFDPDKEWVELPRGDGKLRVRVFYQ